MKTLALGLLYFLLWIADLTERAAKSIGNTLVAAVFWFVYTFTPKDPK